MAAVTTDPDLADRLLPAVPGWTAEPADLSHGEAGALLRRTYRKGRAEAALEVFSGRTAARIVGMMMDGPLGETAGSWSSRTWMLHGRKAHLVRTPRGMASSLALILRGGPGDLAGSVLLTVKGQRLRPDAVEELATALDWDAITTALAGEHPLDAARMAAAAHPPPVPAPSPRAPVLWPMVPSLRSMEQVDKLSRRRPPRFAIANLDAIAAARRAADEGTSQPLDPERRDALGFATMPTPELVIGQRRFAPDYIWWAGLHFASARLRDAIGLGPEAVGYRDVDASGSAAEARAADYKAFRVLRSADPVDFARTYGHEPDREADGSPTAAWLASVSGPHATPRRTVWREGFVPPAPLFCDGSGRLVATDALAERVTRAGLADVAFQDVTSEASLHGFAARPGPSSPGGG